MFLAVKAAFFQAGRRRHSFTVRMSAAPQAAARNPRSQCRVPINGLGGFANGRSTNSGRGDQKKESGLSNTEIFCPIQFPIVNLFD